MNTIDIKEDIVFIRQNIRMLAKKFKIKPSLFFNESDLQSELFAQLLSKYGNEVEVQNISVWGTDKPKPTKKVYIRRLHSELLLEEDRIDLAILDVDNIKFGINSKGRFGYIQLSPGNHIFIEIKASRTNRSSMPSKNKWFDLLFADIKKLSKYSYPSFLVCFDFSGYHDDEKIADLQKSKPDNLEFLYFSSDQATNYFK